MGLLILGGVAAAASAAVNLADGKNKTAAAALAGAAALTSFFGAIYTPERAARSFSMAQGWRRLRKDMDDLFWPIDEHLKAQLEAAKDRADGLYGVEHNAMAKDNPTPPPPKMHEASTAKPPSS